MDEDCLECRACGCHYLPELMEGGTCIDCREMLREHAACPLRAPCKVHGWIHGGEAEELREGIEHLIERFSGAPDNGYDWEYIHRDLQELLDRVDARDSLAYVEASKKEEEG